MTRMDPDEFARWYREEAEAVLLFHTRRTFDAEVALELTAETFAEAWRSRRSMRATGGVEQRAWLFTIARRRWGAYLERGRVERKALARLRMTMPVFHEDDLAEIHERAGLPALRREVAEQLAGLSATHREALQLRIVDERDYPDVARALGVSEQTARARVSRGLRALGRALDAVRTEPSTGTEVGR
jgi:RNA polymerase sigma factor (sigma-70 family)